MSYKYSQWYPYLNTQDSYFNIKEGQTLLKKICDYLIDAPTANYEPIDDNNYSRCRFWKYIYYDEAKPLLQPLPTISQKMSVVFDADNPIKAPTLKGYRLIPQIFTKQSQTDAQTRVYVYLGRTVPSNDEFKLSIAVTFYIWTHYTYELNTHSDEYNRAFNIEQALIEAFHGVNIEGIGTFFFSKINHPDCGSDVIFDGETNVGRRLTIALMLSTTAFNDFGNTNNMPSFNSKGNIKLL